MQHINYVGIELEGAWHEVSNTSLGRFHHDGSVNTDLCDCSDSYDTGEISSIPLRLSEIDTFMEHCYPDHSDASCGLHVHLSFENEGDYARLTCPDFHKFFLKSWEDWGTLHAPEPVGKTNTFWHRLRGKNDFCYRKFIPEEQWHLTDKDSPRYHQLNFCFSFNGTESEDEDEWCCGCCEADDSDDCSDRCSNYECGDYCDEDCNGEHECDDCISNARRRRATPRVGKAPPEDARKTLECRLLPMFHDVELAKHAVWYLVSLVNIFLDTCEGYSEDFTVPIKEIDEDLSQEWNYMSLSRDSVIDPPPALVLL